jgi:hypothetical protein
MAQLEVSPPGPCRRHDLRPLDADPEAPASRRGADLDRRLARGPAHRRRRPVRRGRGRGQGEAPRGGEGAPPPGTRRRRRRNSQAAGKAATWCADERAGAGDRRDRGTTRFSGQAGAGGRPREAKAAAAACGRNAGSPRGACRGSRTGTGSCSSSSLARPLRRHRAWRPEPGHPAPTPHVKARPGLPAPPGTRSPFG